jgi:hypothetical protein
MNAQGFNVLESVGLMALWLMAIIALEKCSGG